MFAKRSGKAPNLARHDGALACSVSEFDLIKARLAVDLAHVVVTWRARSSTI